MRNAIDDTFYIKSSVNRDKMRHRKKPIYRGEPSCEKGQTTWHGLRGGADERNLPLNERRTKGGRKTISAISLVVIQVITEIQRP